MCRPVNDSACSLSNESISSISDEEAGILKSLVSTAHDSSIPVAVSIEGPMVSTLFSAALANAETRAMVIANLINMTFTFSLQGLEIKYVFFVYRIPDKPLTPAVGSIQGPDVIPPQLMPQTAS